MSDEPTNHTLTDDQIIDAHRQGFISDDVRDLALNRDPGSTIGSHYRERVFEQINRRDPGFWGRAAFRLQRENKRAQDILMEIACATGTPEERAEKCQALARKFVDWRPF